MYNLNTPIWQLTVGEFLDLQERAMKPLCEQKDEGNQGKKNLVYGIKGLAKLIGCSTGTAQKIKNSGVIDKAITQFGKKLIIDADMVLSIVQDKKKK